MKTRCSEGRGVAGMSRSNLAATLLSGARSLSEAAEHLASGQSTFGRWAVPGLLPQQGTAVIYGPTGSCKTFFAVHLAVTMAAASPWFGESIERGTVVYLAPEDRLGVEARAVAAAQALSLDLPDVPLHFMTPPPIHQSGWSGNVIAALRQIASGADQVAAIFIDTLGSIFGGRSQDDAAQMTIATDAMQEIAEAFRCSVIAIHHVGKEVGRGMRGSQVLMDRIDTALMLGRAKGGANCVTVTKQRNAPIGAPLTFRLTPATIKTGSGCHETCTLVDLAMTTSASAPETTNGEPEALSGNSPPKLSRDTRAALDALRGLANGSGTTIDLWRAAAYRSFEGRRPDAQRQAFNTAKKFLLRTHMITIEGDSVRFSA